MHHHLAALQGRLGLLLLSVFTLSYLFVGLSPFRWNPPRWEENGAKVESSGTLSLNSTGMVRSASSAPLLGTSIASNELRLKLRFRSAEPVQHGPARIFTISADPFSRNLTVGQEDHDLVVRLRTPLTTTNGLPPYIVNGVFKSASWHDLEVRIVRTDFRLSVDGIEVLADSLPQDALRNWDPEFRVALGNELTWDRPWLGQIEAAVIGVGTKEVDLLRAVSMELPSGFWSGNDWRLIRPRSLFRLHQSTSDLILNLICFIPVGFLLLMMRSHPKTVVPSIAVVAAGSLFVESIQFFFAGRHPSAIDWILNVLGTGLGAWLASYLKKRSLADEIGAS